MKTEPSDAKTVYCPSCFRVVEDQRVFCFFCGQFIHSHVPTDSRLWDSRLSDLAVLEPPPPEEPLTTVEFGNSHEVQVGDWAIALGNPIGKGLGNRMGNHCAMIRQSIAQSIGQ